MLFLAFISTNESTMDTLKGSLHLTESNLLIARLKYLIGMINYSTILNCLNIYYFGTKFVVLPYKL